MNAKAPANHQTENSPGISLPLVSSQSHSNISVNNSHFEIDMQQIVPAKEDSFFDDLCNGRCTLSGITLSIEKTDRRKMYRFRLIKKKVPKILD